MAEVTEMHNGYASKGIANTGLGFGIAGTALSLLGNHVGGWGFGNGNGYGRNGYGCGEGAYCIDRPVGRETFDLQKKISEQESTISLLRSEQNTEVKIADVYARLEKQVLDLERAQNDKWATQGVINAQVAANLSVMQNQIAVLNGLTKTVIPINNVCPEPMPAKNSWEAPTT